MAVSRTDEVIEWASLQAWESLATIGSAVVGAVGLLFIAWQVYQLRVQTRSAQQVHRSEMFLHLVDKWSETLTSRYKVLNEEEVDYETLRKKYKTSSDLFNSKEWADLRKVLNFFEIVGLMVHQDYVTAKEAFVLVSVDHYEQDDAREIRTFEEGKFYRRAQPYLQYLRKHYRSDIYVFYDRYLLPLYHAHSVQPFLPDNPLRPIGWLRKLIWRWHGSGPRADE